MALKTDLVKTDRAYYAAKTVPQIHRFGPLNFLTLVGKGEPAADGFVQATQALFSLAYGLKRLYKQRSQDFAVPSLEGLWWVETNRPALETPRGHWQWKLMIRMPDFVSLESVETTKSLVAKAKKNERIRRIVLETLEEGKCIQVLHMGPYAGEVATIESLQRFASEKGLAVAGPHHEIYLSDPRRVAPEKMKTIIRYPVR